MEKKGTNLRVLKEHRGYKLTERKVFGLKGFPQLQIQEPNGGVYNILVTYSDFKPLYTLDAHEDNLNNYYSLEDLFDDFVDMKTSWGNPQVDNVIKHCEEVLNSDLIDLMYSTPKEARQGLAKHILFLLRDNEC